MSGDPDERKKILLESTNFEEKVISSCNSWLSTSMPQEEARVESCAITYFEDGSRRISKAKVSAL